MKPLCFVMMPFGNGSEYSKGKRESQFVFERIIRPAALDAVNDLKGSDQNSKFEVIRELDDVAPGSITESIIRHVARADLCIVDLTGKNPNVFFELGVRYALRRNGTILIVQDASDMPFNIRQFRVVEYDPYFDSANKARTALKVAIVTSLKDHDFPISQSTDSLVYQSIPDLQVIQSDMSQTERTISWYEYWEQVKRFERMLREVQTTGSFEPHILIGISNGGLLIADTLLRLVYGNKIPLLSLWAARHRKEFFKNPINDTLITTENIERFAQQATEEWDNNSEIRILVIDDIVGTKRTITELLEYLEQRLQELWHRIDLKFLFLYTPRQETLLDLKKHLLLEDKRVPENYRMSLKKEVITRKIELPYQKSIHSGDIMDAQQKTLG